MRWLVAFTALLAVQFGQTVSIKLSTSPGLSVSLVTEGPKRNITRCIATHNNNVYSIYPELNLTNAIYEGYRERCKFTIISSSFDDAGIWMIFSNWTQNNTNYQNITNIELSVRDSVYTIPAEAYKTDDGNYLTAFSNEIFNNLTNCTLYHRPNGTVVNVYELLNVNETNPTIERYGKCGVRLLVNESRYGGWHITQKSGPYKSRQFSFAVQVPDKYDSINEMSVWWNRGSSRTIGLFDHFYKPKYCTITRPDGQTIVLEDNRCSYEIPEVSILHAGTWVIQYSVPEKIYLLETKYHVSVYDKDFVNVTVNATANDIMHLLCTIAERNLDFCVYTSPNGSVINLPAGIGNGKYEYYGNGYKRSSRGGYSECGLTVRNPSVDDYGLWKCSLGVDDKTISAFVPTFDTITTNIVDIKLNYTFVKHGDDLTIKCKTSAPLEYCWLRSPNGTIYTVSNSESTKNTLPYVGEGLAVGVCGAKVKNASNALSGTWSCHLGVVDGGEVEVLVPVTVTESYLYSTHNEINIADEKNPKLTCNILPEKDAIIKYCRWLRPDGHGIHCENSLLYFTSQEQRACTLQLKSYRLENIGEWTCYARLTDDLNEEVFAIINIKSESKYASGVLSTVLNIIAITLLIVTLVGSSIVGVTLYKKKFRRRKAQSEYSTDYEIYDNELNCSREKISKF